MADDQTPLLDHSNAIIGGIDDGDLGAGLTQAGVHITLGWTHAPAGRLYLDEVWPAGQYGEEILSAGRRPSSR